MTVLVANAYVGNKRPEAFAAWVERTGCDVALLCELNPKTYKALRGLGILCGVGNPTTSTVSRRECGAWFAAWDVDGTGLHQLTKQLQRGIGNARFARTARAKGLAFISTHANAAIHKRVSGRWIPSPRTTEWRDKGLPKLASLVRGYQSAGLPVVLGGDMNVTDKGEASFRHFAIANDLRWTSAELMWLTWSAPYRMVKREVLPTPPGADAHPALLVTLEKES